MACKGLEKYVDDKKTHLIGSAVKSGQSRQVRLPAFQPAQLALATRL